MINTKNRDIINSYSFVTTTRTPTYEFMIGTGGRTNWSGGYCIWDKHSDKQCLIVDVPPLVINIVKELMIGNISSDQCVELIQLLDGQWEFLPMDENLRNLILD